MTKNGAFLGTYKYNEWNGSNNVQFVFIFRDGAIDAYEGIFFRDVKDPSTIDRR